MYNASPERLLGMQFLGAVGGVFLWLRSACWATCRRGSSSSAPSRRRVFGLIAPGFVVDRTARKRREQIEKDLPDLIDLVVVTLEAGLSFPQSLRLAATKIKEPLAGEVRLTLQEQNMGLTLVEALENFLSRIDTAGVRMFARSIAQGETMGVSTGQIMRNLAIELRKRRRAYAEERAQKAPVKMLFPIAFLIMPALFMILLVPMVAHHRGRPVADDPMRPIPNLTLRREDGRVVAESVVVADSTMRRLRGLLGKRDLPSGHGILLRPAWSIHTAFMRFPIDVVFLDADQVVIKIVPRLAPSRPPPAAAPARSSSCAPASATAAASRSATGSPGPARATLDEVPHECRRDLTGDRRGAVVLASRDQRYLKLVRFLLDGKGIDVVASVPPSGAADAAGGEAADVVVIDTGDTLGEGSDSRTSRVHAGPRRPSSSSARARRRRTSVCASTRSGTRRTGSSPPSSTLSHERPCSIRRAAGRDRGRGRESGIAMTTRRRQR